MFNGFDLPILIKGLFLGFSVAAPVGPIGLLCIRRSLSFGAKHGLMTGLGAATADALYGSIAAFGVTFLSTILVEQSHWLRLVGSAFLVYLGFKTFFSTSNLDALTAKKETLGSSYLSSLILTVTNPATILSFTAIFAGMGLGGLTKSGAAGPVLVLGVFVGSAVWWLLLSSVTVQFKKILSTNAMTWINRIAGALLIGLAIVAVMGT